MCYVQKVEEYHVWDNGECFWEFSEILIQTVKSLNVLSDIAYNNYNVYILYKLSTVDTVYQCHNKSSATTMYST